jgi:tetratricopeptide (TPR) repeat protein
LLATPGDIAALTGKARAEAALGQIETAVEHWIEVVERAPEPGHVIEFARFLESIGRADEAERQWAVFDATQRLFAANGVLPDATSTLADAERGQVDRALDDATQGVSSRPFLDMHDAHAWALHLAGRDDEALQAIDRALALGTRNARFHFHAGMIARSLGDPVRAERELTLALEINPHFDPLSTVVARETLAQLQADPSQAAPPQAGA